MNRFIKTKLVLFISSLCFLICGCKSTGDKEATDYFPEELRHFINAEKWTYAKTMPEWPHEYIVRERVDENLFEQLVRHIRSNGYKGRFYNKRLTYYEEDGLLYWTMGAPVAETTIINRCRKENSYENRLRNGTLPKQTGIQHD